VQHIDLNLLPVAQALLAERSVTRAAARLHLSVPATSRAWDRCRRTFGDELLVRDGRGYVTTARGAELLEALDDVLGRLAVLVGPAPPFDAAGLRQAFRIRANEVVIATVGAPLIEVVRERAPGVELQFVLESPDDLDALARGDASIAVGSYAVDGESVRSRHLVDEHLVAVVRHDHPGARGRMTMRRFAALDHVVVSRRGIAAGPVDELLAANGLVRRVVAVVPSFAAALVMCATSDLVALVPARLVAMAAGPAGVRAVTPPMPVPTVPVGVFWHARVDADPAHRWLVECVAEAVARVG
jgi:DNA-binding transcriptional LysR family regulator